MAIDTQKLDQMLTELLSASSLAGGKAAGNVAPTDGPDFASVLKGTIDQVDAAQQ